MSAPLCRTSPDDWFPASLPGPEARKAARFCAQCQLREQCWALAQTMDRPAGVWAGRFVGRDGTWRELALYCSEPGCFGDPGHSGKCKVHLEAERAKRRAAERKAKACVRCGAPGVTHVAGTGPWCYEHARRTWKVLERVGQVQDRSLPVVHQCPTPGQGAMPCCGRVPFDVPRSDRMTTDASAVTCNRKVSHERTA